MMQQPRCTISGSYGRNLFFFFFWGGAEDTYKCTGATMDTQGAKCKHKCPISTVPTFWTSECETALLPVSRATWFSLTLRTL
jgi:hypothetical protein